MSAQGACVLQTPCRRIPIDGRVNVAPVAHNPHLKFNEAVETQKLGAVLTSLPVRRTAFCKGARTFEAIFARHKVVDCLLVEVDEMLKFVLAWRRRWHIELSLHNRLIHSQGERG